MTERDGAPERGGARRPDPTATDGGGANTGTGTHSGTDTHTSTDTRTGTDKAGSTTTAGVQHQSRPAGFTRAAVWTVVRLTVTVTGLLLAYMLLPTKGQTGSSDVPWVILSLAVYAAVASWQIPAILRSRWPMLRAIEALTIIIALFLLLFARLYLSNSLGDPAAFSVPLNHVRSLYFTITVFATVGFGDITPQTDGLRILVSVQMLLNLVVLGLLLRLVTGAVQRGRARRSREQGRDGTPDDRAPAAGN